MKTCNLCAGTDRFVRIQKAADDEYAERFGEDMDPKLPLPGDGRRVYTRQLSQLEIDQKRTTKRRR